ncbi:hypothetical protein D8M04_10170 [Oceanobacillus piezotolerans]|uniref:Cytosolic protein n=1 Tax=Oceanobacillus piezotolerans TaxID=2448030 RepID=A0A498DI95_9BACI|nr:YlbD family protein [Oceanobacillus piezotolerans]RLL45215.1 hypothetical protein D8M04_10170 [Oceanobacillus piezotolerans]
MEKENLHPSVVQFKRFVNDHPELLKELRKTGRPWQEYYEKWSLLGEDDPFWDEYKAQPSTSNSDKKESADKDSEKRQFELLGQLMKVTENIDMNKVQGQISNLSKTIGTVQELIEQFQSTKKPKNIGPSRDPFNWFKD